MTKKDIKKSCYNSLWKYNETRLILGPTILELRQICNFFLTCLMVYIIFRVSNIGHPVRNGKPTYNKYRVLILFLAHFELPLKKKV